MEYTIPYMGNTVDFLPYLVETVGKKKNLAKHGVMRWTPKLDKNHSPHRIFVFSSIIMNVFIYNNHIYVLG